jgi:hypothetical protein
MSLSETLGDPDTKKRVVDDCVELVDSEVSKKSGLGGVVIKTGYRAVKGIKPGFIRQVVDALLPRWVEELEPIYAEASSQGGVRVFFDKERGRVADALLKVTDDKAQSAKSGVVAKTYAKLRPTAKRHVEAAVPGLAAVVDKHAR